MVLAMGVNKGPGVCNTHQEEASTLYALSCVAQLMVSHFFLNMNGFHTVIAHRVRIRKCQFYVT